MTDKSEGKAIIIGGSLGGLFAASTLRAIGWSVEVYERPPHQLDGRGGGLVLQPAVLSALRFAGIEDPQALGVDSDDRIYLDADDRVVQRQYMPQTQTSWNMLYSTLRQALPAHVIHSGKRFIDFAQTREGVHARFASGHVVTGDLLIGADGARSAVRNQLLPELTPRYAGYVAWRGLAREDSLPTAVNERLAQTFAFQQGEGHLLLEYLIPGEDGSTHRGARRRNWVWYRPVLPGAELDRVLTDRTGLRHHFSLPPGTAAAAVVADMRQAAQQHLAPIFRQLVAATDDPFLQTILDFQVPQMVFGRAVLLGDAASIPRPHTAGGAAKAAANALALAEALQASPASIPLALRRWESAQLKEGRAMSAWGISIGDRLMGLSRHSARTTPKLKPDETAAT